MATYAYARASTEDQKNSPEVQEDEARKYCDSKGISDMETKFEPQGTSGMIPFRNRPMGKWLLRNLRCGDVLIFLSVDRMSRKMSDVMWTADRLRNMGIQVVILQFNGMQIDLSTDIGQLILGMTAFGAQLEHSAIAERTRRGRERKMAAGTWCIAAGWGRRKVKDAYGAHPEWDHEQLKYICEIAHRMGKGESAESVAKDFWARGIKDHRGLPFGEVQRKKEGGNTPAYRNFAIARRWFHRMKHAGKLPPPYNDIAKLCIESSRFSVEPRKYATKPKPPAETDDRADWTADQWREWYEEEGNDSE